MTTEPQDGPTDADRVDAGLGALVGVWGVDLLLERVAARYGPPTDDPKQTEASYRALLDSVRTKVDDHLSRIGKADTIDVPLTADELHVAADALAVHRHCINEESTAHLSTPWQEYS